MSHSIRENSVLVLVAQRVSARDASCIMGLRVLRVGREGEVGKTGRGGFGVEEAAREITGE
jgi:hypothetical protein